MRKPKIRKGGDVMINTGILRSYVTEKVFCKEKKTVQTVHSVVKHWTCVNNVTTVSYASWTEDFDAFFFFTENKTTK